MMHIIFWRLNLNISPFSGITEACCTLLLLLFATFSHVFYSSKLSIYDAAGLDSVSVEERN